MKLCLASTEMGGWKRAMKQMATQKRDRSVVVHLLALALLLALEAGLASAHANDELRTYIVQMSGFEKPSVYTTHKLWYYSTFSAVKGVEMATNDYNGDGHPDGILYTYDSGFHGFAARLTASEAKELEVQPGVLNVYPEGDPMQLHTTHTLEFVDI